MFMGLWIIIMLVAVLAAVGWGAAQGSNARPTQTSAHEILDQRLARGELTSTEYDHRRATLGTDTQARGPDWRPWTIAGIGLAALLLPALAFGMGWGGSWDWDDAGWMGEHMGWGSGTTATSTATFEGAREVTVEAGDLWFEPERIEVTAGEEFNVRVVNSGEVFHDLTVPAADMMLDVEAGDEIAGGLRLEEPGAYEFFCSVPGHAAAGMTGTIVVTP